MQCKCEAGMRGKFPHDFRSRSFLLGPTRRSNSFIAPIANRCKCHESAAILLSANASRCSKWSEAEGLFRRIICGGWATISGRVDLGRFFAAAPRSLSSPLFSSDVTESDGNDEVVVQGAKPTPFWSVASFVVRDLQNWDKKGELMQLANSN